MKPMSISEGKELVLERSINGRIGIVLRIDNEIESSVRLNFRRGSIDY
jgi:hypothetical protein